MRSPEANADGAAQQAGKALSGGNACRRRARGRDGRRPAARSRRWRRGRLSANRRPDRGRRQKGKWTVRRRSAVDLCRPGRQVRDRQRGRGRPEPPEKRRGPACPKPRRCKIRRESCDHGHLEGAARPPAQEHGSEGLVDVLRRNRAGRPLRRRGPRQGAQRDTPACRALQWNR